ncbi:MAG TPA: hypothetical protein VLJ37_02920 [bacterium]|nr:hypothetical protein [bacterium]
MNAAQLHLLVNHIPIFGVAFGLAALLWSLARGSKDMRWASIALFLVSGAFAWVAVESGERAEDLVENLPGVVKSLIHDHEEAAETTNVSIILLAALSLVMAAAARFKPALFKGVQVLVVVLALVSSVLLARTAHRGGLIRHTEIRGAAAGNTQGEGRATNEEDD